MNVKLLYCHDISFSFSFSFVPFLVTMKSKVFFFPIYVPVRVMSIQSTTIKNVLVLLVRFFDNTHTLYLQGQEDSSNDTTRERILQPSTGYSLGTSSRILNHSFPVDQNFSHNEEVVPRSIALPEIPPVDKSPTSPKRPCSTKRSLPAKSEACRDGHIRTTGTPVGFIVSGTQQSRLPLPDKSYNNNQGLNLF